MLIVMTLCVVMGGLLLGLAYLFFIARRDSRLALVKGHVDGEIAKMRRQADDVSTGIVHALVVEGVPLERATADYHARRSQILAHDRPAESWNWNSDDLQAYRNREYQSRCDAINRQVLVRAVTTFVVIIAATISIVAVAYYHHRQSGVVSLPTVPAAGAGTESAESLPLAFPMPLPSDDEPSDAPPSINPAEAADSQPTPPDQPSQTSEIQI